MINLDKFRRSRQRDVTAGGFTFTIQVPTEFALFKFLEEHRADSEMLMAAAIAKAFVIDWKGVKETDVLSSGMDEPQPFVPELFAEWIETQPDLWGPISDTVFAARNDLLATKEADRKN